MDARTSASTGVGAVEKLRFPKGYHAWHRPAPSDFVQVAKTKGPTQLKRFYQANDKTVARWYRETGAPKVYSKAANAPPPEDLAEVAARMTKTALERHYGKSHETVARWLGLTGVVPMTAPLSGAAVKRRPIPRDFAYHAPRFTQAELERHYSTARPTLLRWLSETGIKCRVHPHRDILSGRQIQSAPQVDSSTVAQAAQFLRSRFIIYRCDILLIHERAKSPDHGRGLWYVNGRGAVSAEAVIELAESRGFDRRAWARI